LGNKPIVLAEPEFVGREKELKQLESYLSSIIQGNGKTVFLFGEAGSGKSRLVKEFVARAKKKGIQVLAGWCLSNSGVPYFPFIEAFDSYFADYSEVVTLQSNDISINPTPASVTSMVIDELGVTGWLTGSRSSDKPSKDKAWSLSPQVWKDQAFRAVSNSLHEISSRAPVILLIEDIHWADSASLALLHYLARLAGTERILLLSTIRSEELTSDSEGRPHHLAEEIRLMKREDLLTEFKLSNLDQASVSAIAQNMLGGAIQQKFKELLSAESNGNALFIVESLRMLSERKAIIQENNEWRLSIDTLGIPSKVKDIILRRLSVLNYKQRKFLDAASVIGEKFDAELLASVLGQDILEVLETLNLIAQSTSIMQVQEDCYKFDHARSREILYEALPPPLKHGYHTRVAEVLESKNKEGKLPFAELAYHWAEADNKEKAIKYSLKAGQEALDRWANTEAAKHFRYVINSIREEKEHFDQRITALEGLGDAYYASNNFIQATNIFEQLAELQVGALRLRALRKAIVSSLYQGDLAKPQTLMGEAMKIAHTDPLEAGRILFKQALLLMHIDYLAGSNMLKEAVEFFESEYALADAAESLFWMGYTDATQGQLEQGVAHVLRSINLLSELGDFRSQIEAYAYAGGVFQCCTLLEEANQMTAKAFEINEEYKIEDYVRMIPALVWWSTGLMGTNLKEAISKDQKALEYCEKTDSNLYLGGVYSTLVVEYALAGDVVHAQECFSKLMNLPKHIKDNIVTQSFLAATIGVYHALQNEFEQSNQVFDAFLAHMPNPYELFTRQLYAWALSRQGKLEDAKLQLEKAQKIVEACQSRFSQTNLKTSLMTFTRPEINQKFDLKLDIINVSKKQGAVLKIEGLLVPELELIESSLECIVRDGYIELKEKNFEPFQVKTIKLTVKATRPVAFQLQPTVSYTDNMGSIKRVSTRQFTIAVRSTFGEASQIGKISTGLNELDQLLLGGIPAGYAIALLAPLSDERNLILESYVEAGLRNGEVTFYFCTEQEKALLVAKQNLSAAFLFVCNPRSDLIASNLPNIVRLAGVDNLTDIDIAVTKALRQLDSSSRVPKRAVIEIVSDVLLQHRTLTTRKWLSGLIQELKSKGFTIMSAINPQMHSHEEVQAILSLFDGEVQLTEKQDETGSKKTLRILRLSNQNYLKNEALISRE